MRVLETSQPSPYAMGKKHRLRKNRTREGYNTDSSEEGKSCRHLNKSLNLASMRKNLRQLTPGHCTGCAKDSFNPTSPSETIAEDKEQVTVWVCLQCGNQGCDRNSEEKHALRHYHTPRSVSHAMAVNTATWVIWCYDCDDEVDPMVSKKLQESLEYLRRLFGASIIKADLPNHTCTSKEAGALDFGSSMAEDCSNGQLMKQEDNNRNRSVVNPALFPKVKGLSNLGNTCFFNAVMQNVSQTYELEAMLSDKTKSDIELRLLGSKDVYEEMDATSEEDDDSKSRLTLEPLTVNLPECGSMTQTVFNFIRDMNSSSKNKIVSPATMFGSVCKKAPRFKGFQQQDSHELLRSLLDGMKTEEIRRAKEGILKELSVNPKKIDDETKAKLKEYGKQVKHTFVDSLFGGHLVSSVMCEECNTSSQVFESFLDLSLPVLEDKGSRPNSTSSTKMADDRGRLDDNKPATAVDGFAQNSKHISKKQEKARKKLAKKKVPTATLR